MITPDLLTHIYMEKEDHYKKKWERSEVYDYFDRVIDQDRIIWIEDNGIFQGFIESLRFDYDQLGRWQCSESMNIHEEDITSGDICFIMDFWVDVNYRNTQIPKILKYKLYMSNLNAKYWAWEWRSSRDRRPIQVMNTDQAYKLWIKDNMRGLSYV